MGDELANQVGEFTARFIKLEAQIITLTTVLAKILDRLPFEFDEEYTRLQLIINSVFEKEE